MGLCLLIIHELCRLGAGLRGLDRRPRDPLRYLCQFSENPLDLLDETIEVGDQFAELVFALVKLKAKTPITIAVQIMESENKINT